MTLPTMGYKSHYICRAGLKDANDMALNIIVYNCLKNMLNIKKSLKKLVLEWFFGINSEYAKNYFFYLTYIKIRNKIKP